MAAKAGELMLELGDPQRLGLDQRDQALGRLTQLGRILGQRLGFAQHGRSIPQQLGAGNPAIELNASVCYKISPSSAVARAAAAPANRCPRAASTAAPA